MGINFMNQDKINIEPKEDVVKRELSSITISVEEVELFKSAKLVVAYFDQNGSFVKFDRFSIEGEDYTNWSNDDQYIYDYVYARLNITPLPTGN